MIIRVADRLGKTMAEKDITGSRWIAGHNGLENEEKIEFEVTEAGVATQIQFLFKAFESLFVMGSVPLRGVYQLEIGDNLTLKAKQVRWLP